jgi:hypothetical protein
MDVGVRGFENSLALGAGPLGFEAIISVCRCVRMPAHFHFLLGEVQCSSDKFA